MPGLVSYDVRDEQTFRGGRRVRLTIHTHDDRVPGILLLPGTTARVPGVLLLHGFTSRKERMADYVGSTFLEHGIASLALDLPLHGERDGTVHDLSIRNPFELMRRWQMARAEAAAGLRLLSEHSAVDPTQLAVVGYSLGAFLAVTLAADERAVRAVVLAAGGDLPARTPFAGVVRTIADPLRAVRKLAGRPLLMLHGRYDRTVRPEQAERLYAAAGEPKSLRWWSAGHVLPDAAIHEAARWLAERLTGERRERMPG